MDKEGLVQDVIKSVASGTRTRKELKRCGCEVCKEALKRLKGRSK